MISFLHIVIPYRNRPLSYLKRALTSIQPQLCEDTVLTIVDYGSPKKLQDQLASFIKPFSHISVVTCPAQGMLWNKSRCINIVLKQTTAEYIMVADVDVIWHPEFISCERNQWSKASVTYYPVGIMSREESISEKQFLDYKTKFITDQEATGISVFDTAKLRGLNGFDEFYHGWGSEDTDAIIRMKNAGHNIRYRDINKTEKTQLYFKHQWHAKAYRGFNSLYPYHTIQEKVNSEYLNLQLINKCRYGNQRCEWGQIPAELPVKEPDYFLKIHSTIESVHAGLAFIKQNSGYHELEITPHPESGSLILLAKRLLNRKTPSIATMTWSNNTVLDFVITQVLNEAYDYSFVNDKIRLLVVS